MKKAQDAKINLYHMRQFAKFVEKMKNTPEGNGSLLARQFGTLYQSQARTIHMLEAHGRPGGQQRLGPIPWGSATTQARRGKHEYYGRSGGAVGDMPVFFSVLPRYPRCTITKRSMAIRALLRLAIARR